MEFKQLDRKIIDGWRTSRLIRLGLVMIPALVCTFFFNMDDLAFRIIVGVLWAFVVYCLVGLILYPPIEYKRWGYYIDQEKVVIRRGLFFLKQTIVPIIRIQNITISQGPINRHLGLYTVEIALASGSHEIVGLNQETADSISESLRAKLYIRIEEKGVL